MKEEVVRKIYVLSWRLGEDFESPTDGWQPLACFETRQGAEARVEEHKEIHGIFGKPDFMTAEFDIQEIELYEVYPDGA